MSSLREGRYLISGGIVPEKLFVDKFKEASLERLPICGGIEP